MTDSTSLRRMRTYRRSTLTVVLAAAALLAGWGGVAQASHDPAGPARRGPIPDVLSASSPAAVARVSTAVASVVASPRLFASPARGTLQSLSVDGYLVFDAHLDDGVTDKVPELASAVMAVPVNDPATAYDDSSVLLFTGVVSPSTDSNDWAVISLDVNGDPNDDYYVEAPNLLMVEGEDYVTEIVRFDGANWVGTGQGALWSRLSGGYVVGFDWRALGLTSTRFVFGLSDIDFVLYDWAPNDYTGPLITLPQPDSDGDGVIDSQDACPTVAGVAAYGGCPPPPPDADGDGVLDAQDACPTVPGSAGIGGCPDSDGDGVADVQDACPTVAGVAAYGGCPPPPSAVVRVKATSGRSKLSVDVNPNKGSGYWTFQVQRQRPDGSWKALKTYRTKGSKETRTINLKKGTYQVVVNAKYGHLGTTSAPVYLKK